MQMEGFEPQTQEKYHCKLAVLEYLVYKVCLSAQKTGNSSTTYEDIKTNELDIFCGGCNLD